MKELSRAILEKDEDTPVNDSEQPLLNSRYQLLLDNLGYEKFEDEEIDYPYFMKNYENLPTGNIKRISW